MRVLLAGEVAETAEIDGASAADANPDVMVHTPSAGTDFETLAVDAGLAKPTGAPSVTIGRMSGSDIRTADPMPDAPAVVEQARALGRELPDDEVVFGETVPGGTTTALGILTALGEAVAVSSSLPENPLLLAADAAVPMQAVRPWLAGSLTTAGGDSHETAGILPTAVRMHDGYQALDHVELEATRDPPTAAAGTRLRGHEFHHSGTECGRDARFAFDVVRGDGIDGERDGLLERRSPGPYCHLHAESSAFDAFVTEVADG